MQESKEKQRKHFAKQNKEEMTSRDSMALDHSDEDIDRSFYDDDKGAVADDSRSRAADDADWCGRQQHLLRTTKVTGWKIN